MKLYLYAVYRLGVCVYVGLTIHPKKRMEQHRNPTRGKLRDLKRLKMKILRAVDFSNGARIEGQVIRAYQRRGEAAHNKRTCGAQGYANPATHTVIRCLETGRVYRSYAEVARERNLTYSTFANHMKSGECGFVVESRCGRPAKS